MPRFNFQSLLFLALSFIASSALAGQYSLQSQQSSLHFVSVKNTVVAEVHDFTKLSGNIDANGKATVSIDLASAQTHIDIRNQRLGSMLFHIAKFPSAVVTANLDEAVLDSVKAGDELTKNVDLSVDLHGHQKTYSVSMRIVKLANGALQASTEAPILLNAADFALDKGIEALRDVAKLQAISPIVAVTATLVFAPAK